MGVARITNEQIFHLIDEGKSMREICESLQVGKSSIRKRLRKFNIDLPNRWNETKFNENVFDSIDTEEKAYWLGFIFADGYISSSNYTFEISLSIRDIGHLRKFNAFMGYRGDRVKVGKTNFEGCDRCRWSVTNKHLWSTLRSLGCTPKKSLTLKFPNIEVFNNEDLIHHFIRGYWDGDGCIRLGRNDRLVCSANGTESFLNSIVQHSKIPRSILKTGSKAMCIAYSDGPAHRMCEYLYNNATIFLDRKYNRYRFAVLQSNL